jgi:hypothetical protein
LKANIDPRFRGPKARALCALLIYLGPILRGWERLKWRVREMRINDQLRLAPTEQKARLDLADRALTLSYWSEKGDEKEVMIGGLMHFLGPQKYFIVPDTGWSDWDLKIARGLWCRAFVTVVAENHGGMKRLLRVRTQMRFSQLSAFALRSYAVLTAAALILGVPTAAAVIGALGLGHFGYIAWQTLKFGRLMHRIVETVAKSGQLVPLEPVARAPIAVGAPKAA